ncbi:MAG: sphinganine-1-phosphate aldolase [Chitinophagales bacterium]|jgi:sphinganine-1-phosphate aldolase
MKIPQKGKSKEVLLSELKERKKIDFDWKNGRIFASIYDAGEEARSVIYEAYQMFLTENLVDPTLFPSLRDMENEVVSMCADLLQGDENTVGTLTSGGTESCLLAVKTAKFHARKQNPDIKAEIIVPYTIHFAFLKACEYFDVKAVVVPVTSDYKADLDAIENAINANTVLIVGSAPSYAYGAIDPIEEMGHIALKHNILFHVDGCIGAFVLAFNRKAGYSLPPFDFSVPGVTSISMDLHKYGYAAKGCSVLLHRTHEVRKSQFFVSTDWTGYNAINTTILSTKPGGPVAGAWTAFNYFGQEGYIKISQDTMLSTEKFIEGIMSIEGFYMLGKPITPLVAFAHEKYDVFQIADEMKSLGWFLTSQLSSDVAPANLHLTVTMAHKGVEDDFLRDLATAVENVKKGFRLRKLKDDATTTIVKKLVSNMSAETLGKVSEKLGISGGETPKKLALISRLLDELPNDVTQPMLLDFMSDFYTLKD